jgi:apolipoprotein N-acyltransferase
MFVRVSVTIAAIIGAIIMLQTLWFKFTGAPESVYIFTTLGAEPWGRYGSGVLELVSGILLLLNRKTVRVLGAVLGLGLMAGAIGSHVFWIGIAVKDDNGLLFSLAVVAAIACIWIIIIDGRSELSKLLKSKS